MCEISHHFGLCVVQWFETVITLRLMLILYIVLILCGFLLAVFPTKELCIGLHNGRDSVHVTGIFVTVYILMTV